MRRSRLAGRVVLSVVLAAPVVGRGAPAPIVNDVTQLNPIAVQVRVLCPTCRDELPVGQYHAYGLDRVDEWALADVATVRLFYGCIGGYGGLGVIVEATLHLVDNTRMARAVRRLPVTAYRDFFMREIRDAPDAVFHNGDLYPPRYDTVTAVTWSKTERPATVEHRLMPLGGNYWAEHAAQFGVSELPFGKELRRGVLDPLRLRGQPVVWRNFEASYDTEEIEPWSRRRSTYVLEEYFVPVARFRRLRAAHGAGFP